MLPQSAHRNSSPPPAGQRPILQSESSGRPNASFASMLPTEDGKSSWPRPGTLETRRRHEELCLEEKMRVIKRMVSETESKGTFTVSM
jgi:hypothetical protein